MALRGDIRAPDRAKIGGDAALTVSAFCGGASSPKAFFKASPGGVFF